LDRVVRTADDDHDRAYQGRRLAELYAGLNPWGAGDDFYLELASHRLCLAISLAPLGRLILAVA
jgi:hypothetical protein